ncbi:MAG: hypothetical protein ACM3ML_22190 [Micromonosporaceae bacterium]
MKLSIFVATGAIGRHVFKRAGTIDYTDIGGDGPVILLLHRLLMDAALRDG